MRIKIFLVGITFTFIGAFFFREGSFRSSVLSSLQEEKSNIGDIQPVPSEQSIEEQEKATVDVTLPDSLEKKILQAVPFTSQAPMGNWKDIVFQNACEEATLLMAEKWTSGKKFGTSKESEVEIKKLTKAEEKYFPKNSYDLSISDTLLLAQKYFPEMQISLVKNVTIDDIKNTLSEGNIVIVPANGRKLQNPNFTAPGPLYHTLLVRGYDPVTDEFIANDPGTRKGNGYRYASAILFDAMQNYATGHHGKLFPDEKVMLVIHKDTSLGGRTSK